MTTRRSTLWFAVIVGLLVLVAAGAWGLRYMMGRPMFEPGTVAARAAAAGESLDPPRPQRSDAEAWALTPTITVHHFVEGTGPTPVVIVHGGPGFPPLRPWRAGDGEGIFGQRSTCSCVGLRLDACKC